MNQDWKWRVYGLVILIILSIATLLPTITGFLYPEEDVLSEGYTSFFKNRLVLGLDLQGGIHLQYKVDVKEALLNKSRNLAVRFKDELPNAEELSALKGKNLSAKSRAQGTVEEVTQITFSLENDADYKYLSANISTYLNGYFPEYEWLRDDSASRSVVIGMRRDAIDRFQADAVEQAIETIERRINAFGVAESSISKRDQDKIVVELPGLNEKEFGKAKEKLSQTGLLHFKIVEFDMNKSSEFFAKLPARQPNTASWPSELKGLESHKVYVSGSIVRSTSKEVLEYMVNQSGLVDAEHIVGYEKIYVDPTDISLSPKNKLTAQQEKLIDQNNVFNPADNITKAYQLYYLRLDGMSGENVEDAQVSFDNFNRPVTNMRFSAADADEFAKLTEKNVGKNMAILIDNIVYSAPVINERIGGGRVQISMGSGGSSVLKEAQQLAAVLKSGALQAPLRPLYNSQVGPTLGQDSIESGKNSILIGFLLVVAFMILYYGKSGLIANVALFLNILFIAAGLALFGATLTLPGIAGIVLTIGMAVDANVLIFERMKEERRLGVSEFKAIEAGYEKAWSAILDSNLTTGIAAIVLYQFGTGPIKGFAVTLGVGIISSMYTAIVVTRLIFEYLNQQRKVQA
jgi:preprotein translocase subunit SecD